MEREILNTVSQFLKEEIELHNLKFDKNITMDNYKRKGESFFNKYFVNYLDLALGGSYKMKIDLVYLLDDEIDAAINNNRERNIFRIEHYKKTKMSKAFDYLEKIDEIFVCYVSDTLTLSNKKVLFQFVFSKIDNKYKILAKRFKNLSGKASSYESLQWGDFTSQADGYKIEDYGELVELKDLVTPEW